MLKNKSLLFQIEEYTKTQVFHKNLTAGDAGSYLTGKLSSDTSSQTASFKNALVETQSFTANVLVSKKGTITIKKKVNASVKQPKISLSHNRKKKYILEEGIPVPFLIDLGVMTQNGNIVNAHYDKFRQINRFLEYIEDILPSLPTDRELRILDFGCGKSYLTFAIYYYLKVLKGYPVRITGLDLKEDVISLNDDSFMVKRHLRYVEFFRASSSWDNLETIEISDIREHIAPLIRPKKEDELARRFDYLVYSIDLGLLQSKSIQSPVNIVVQTAEKLSAKYSIPQVEKKKEIIEKVQTNEFWDKVTIIELDTVREALRGLLQYLDRQVRPIYYTNFTDSITDGTPGEPLYGGNDLKNYRKKVEFYLKEHSDKLSVYKLKNNKKLTETDLRELERILWTELGSKEDYIKEYGETPIGRLVRKIVGVDRAAVNEAFSCFMSEERLNINQMRFVNLIVDYIVANGNIEDNKVLMGEPFKSVGSITTLFKDDMSTAKQIMEIVNQIKRNSEEIA